MTSATASGPRRAAALPPDERRAAIVAAVLPLLAEHGDRITTREIADAAGIAEGTIFRAFADKDELLAAALEAALDPAPFEGELAEIDATIPFERRLVEATRIIQRRVVNVWAVVSSLSASIREQAARPIADSPGLIAIFEAERDRLRMTSAEAARTLRALTLSSTHPMLAGHPATAEEIVETLLHGVESPDARGGAAGSATNGRGRRA